MLLSSREGIKEFLNSDEYWDFQDWLHGRRQYASSAPWDYDFLDSGDSSSICIIVYAYMLNAMSPYLTVTDITFDSKQKGIQCTITPPASLFGSQQLLFTGDTALPWQLPYKAEYNEEEDVLVYLNDALNTENLNRIGNFYPLPKGDGSKNIKSLSDIKGKKSSAKGMRKGTKTPWMIYDYFDLYLQYVATYAIFQERTGQNVYRVPLLDTSRKVNFALRGAITSPELQPYFGLFQNLDDFVEKNYLQDLFYSNGQYRTLIPIHKAPFANYIRFTETFAAARGKRIVSDIVSGKLFLF